MAQAKRNRIDMKLQKPKGTQDILPQETAKWQYLENVARETFALYHYGEIRTPMFEHYEVISRSVGDTTDIVTKEMYDFEDKGGRHITLRPEGTAPVVRAYVENKFYAPEVQKPTKLYYMGPMFRYERPQAGRLREFHQIGVECFGSANPATDVETMAMAYQLFNKLGVKDVTLHLNSLGNAESRAAYRQALIDYLTPLKDKLSADSQRRLAENPLRVLDSKDAADKEAVAGAPSILDYLDQESSEHFASVRSMLESLQIPYVIDTNMVRGLDYYNHTIFEFITEVENTELTICAGGRYDSLVSYFDGPETPGFGFGLGMERLLLIMEKQGLVPELESPLDVYVIVLGEEVNSKALELVQSLRSQGLRAERDYLDRKIKAQFKTADKFQARYVITLGADEVARNQASVTHKVAGEKVSVTATLDAIATDLTSVVEKAL